MVDNLADRGSCSPSNLGVEMGMDVTLFAVGDITDQQLADANAFLTTRGVYGYNSETHRDDGPALKRDKWADNAVEWNTLDRYYSPGYERGHWPTIHNAIVCIQAALPHCDVFYGGDAVDPDECLRVTDEWLAEMWAHWLGPQGNAYREGKRKFMAELRTRNS